MRHQWRHQVFEASLTRRLLQGLQYVITTKLRPKGLFLLLQIKKKEILQSCRSLESTLTYRVAFLLAFYGLFCISNLAPVNSRLFDMARHLLRSDIRFAFPGVCVRVKWAKDIQAPERHHWVELSAVQDSLMCRASILSALLDKFRLKPCEPLLILDDYHLLRSCLATFLHTMGMPLEGHGFHTFHRSVATIAYKANASLTAIKTHGLWHSDAIWSYISDNTSQALQVPLTFQCFINNKCYLGFGLFPFV